MDREQAIEKLDPEGRDWQAREDDFWLVQLRERLAAIEAAAREVVEADEAWLGNEDRDTTRTLRLAMARLRALLSEHTQPER